MDEMQQAQPQDTTVISQVETPPPNPPAAPQIQESGIHSYATFLDRFLASLIDWVILFPINLIIGFGLGTIGAEDLAGIIGAVIGYGYMVYFIGSSGSTLGKKAMKIKVIKTDNAQLTYVDAFLREVVGKIVSGITLGIGYLWMIWDPNKQCLHDKIAKTYVVKV